MDNADRPLLMDGTSAAEVMANTAAATSAVTDDPEPFVCADCGALHPDWASINRGVLICSECCSVHRSLGRHLSQVRSLKKGAWYGSQQTLVETLYRAGANNVWEHELMREHTTSASAQKLKKKPVSNDPVIPKKESFIKAKYAQLAYAIRPARDDDLTLDELNKQLWCCVRTSHVETALRLLALGADPNYADASSGNATPLHVAAKEGQTLQVELLWIYGADVATCNSDGAKPAAVARDQKFFDLAARLDALEFDVTDRFSMFLCARNADHTHNQHFLIPELAAGPSVGQSTLPFRALLQNSSGVVLERLIQDVYDEVDRREVCIQWHAAEQYRFGNHQHVAVFLPPLECLSATRNQSRQKLAKFDLRDFAQLLIDLLKEIRRRYYGLPLPPPQQQQSQLEQQQHSQQPLYRQRLQYSNAAALLTGDLHSQPLGVGRDGIMDESRDYDEVADALHRSRFSNSTKRSSEPALQRLGVSDESVEFGTAALKVANGSAPIAHGSNAVAHDYIALDNYLELKERLAETNEKLDTVLNTNTQLLNSFNIVQNLVDRLQSDQSELRGRVETLVRMQSTKVSTSSEASDLFLRRVASPPPSALSGRAKSPKSEVGAVVLPTSTLLMSTSKNANLTGRHLSSTGHLHANPQSHNHHRQHSLNTPLHVGQMGFSSSFASSAAEPRMTRKASGGAAQFCAIRRDTGVRSPPLASLSLSGSKPKTEAEGFTTSRNERASGEEENDDDDANGESYHEKYVSEKTYNYQQSKTSAASSASHNTSRLKALFNDEVFPDNLILETELLTGAIKNLLADVQQQGGNNCSAPDDANTVFHADWIGHHISQITRTIVPAATRRTGGGSIVGSPLTSNAVQRCIADMETAMSVLSRRCHARPLNADETVQAAYDVAKSAKQLLEIVHQHDAEQFT